MDTRYTPKLRFEVDRGQENAMTVSEILARIQQEKEGATDDRDQNDSGEDATPHSND